MHRLRAAWLAGAAALASAALVAGAQTVTPTLRIEHNGLSSACNDLYGEKPFDKPFQASCIVRGEADPSGKISATVADCDRDAVEPFAKACLESYRVTEAWRGKTTAVCTEVGFSHPERADSKYNGATISGSTSMSWIETCPPSGATRDPSRATEVFITPDALKDMPPGAFGKDVTVTPLTDLPPEIQKIITEQLRTAPQHDPMRITQDFNDKAFAECFKPAAGKKEPFEEACRVTGEIDGKGKVGKTKATCADKSLEKPAESCVGSYKLMDRYAGYRGPICSIVTYIAAPKTNAAGKTVMSPFHRLGLCEPAQ